MKNKIHNKKDKMETILETEEKTYPKMKILK
jgi:hypothetical protein